MQLTPEQESAVQQVIRWHGSNERELTLAGLAGTGKTTIIGKLLERYPAAKTWQVLSPTGKAADRARQKGALNATTIHSFAFDFVGETTDAKGKVIPVFNRKDEVADRPVCIVDEASMVNGEMYAALMGHSHVRYIWVGDHGQLAPVGADPGIMRNPTIRLETIMRQAAENPILQLAMHVRKGSSFASFESVGPVRIVDRATVSRIVEFSIANGVDQILCGFNKTRTAINLEHRRQAGYTGILQAGEKIIALKNMRRQAVFNGMQFIVEEILERDETEDPNTLAVRLRRIDDGRVYGRVLIWGPALGRLESVMGETIPSTVCMMDYATAITTHKSQGSEWAFPLIVDEQTRNWDSARWRYTAVTRAKDKLVVALGVSP